MKNRYKHWKYKNITFLLLSLVLAYFVFRNEVLHGYLLHLGNFGYLGAFLAGILFVSTFTVATGAIILFVLAETLSPIEIGIIAGFGAVVGDFIIFRFVKDDLAREIKSIYNQIDTGHHLKKFYRPNILAGHFPSLGLQ